MRDPRITSAAPPDLERPRTRSRRRRRTAGCPSRAAGRWPAGPCPRGEHPGSGGRQGGRRPTRRRSPSRSDRRLAGAPRRAPSEAPAADISGSRRQEFGSECRARTRRSATRPICRLRPRTARRSRSSRRVGRAQRQRHVRGRARGEGDAPEAAQLLQRPLHGRSGIARRRAGRPRRRRRRWCCDVDADVDAAARAAGSARSASGSHTRTSRTTDRGRTDRAACR